MRSLLLSIWALAAADCFSDAVPQVQRRNLSSLHPVGLVGSGGFSSVLKILIEERLGYVTQSHHLDTPLALRALALEPARYHVAGEAWAQQDIWEQLQRDFPATLPRNLGNSGYYGSRSMYLPLQLQQRAFDTEGLTLQFYLSYSSSRHDLGNYFGAVNLSETRLKPCNETRLSIAALMAKYLEVTGDLEGVENASGIVEGKCFEDFFWNAPRCRSSLAGCLMFFTGGDGWGLEQSMQRATAFHLPLVMAVAKTMQDFAVLPHEVKSLFYWWVPDATFLALKPLELIFPPYDAIAHAQGDLRTASQQISVDKYVSQELRGEAPGVEELVGRVQLSLAKIQELLQDQVDGADQLEGTCHWLKSNEPLWQSWIPEASACIESYGLYHPATSSFVLHREEHLLELQCRPCPSGHVSQILRDSLGRSFVCMPCPVGTAGAGRASGCELCPAGTYQDRNGSSACEKCGVGKYQDLLGQSECKDCPDGTTSGRRATELADCGCKEGSIRLQGSCVSCGLGLTCPFSSTLESLTTGVAVDGDFIPTVQRGFHSSLAAPLEVYQCRKNWHCPGSVPGQCAGGRAGSACAQCPAGEMWLQGSCKDCNWQVFLAWGLCCALGFLVVAASYYFVSGRVDTQASLSVAVSMVFIELVNIWQIIAVIGLVQVEWPEEVEAIFKEASIFVLDLDEWGVRCIVGQGTFGSYLFSVALIPAAQFWLILVCAVSQLWPHPWSWPQVNSSMGSLLTLAFITISNVALTPFTCYAHPNGERSVVKFPEMLCKDAGPLQTAGLVLMTFYMLVFAALCLYGALNLPQWMASRRRDMVLSFRFLIFRTRVDRWWFEAALLARGPLLSLVMVVVPDSFTQMLVLTVLLATFLLVHTFYWPWKVPILNVFDMLVLLLIMLIASVAPAQRRYESLRVSSLVVVWLVMMIASLFVLTIFVIVNRRLFRDENIFFNLGLVEAPTSLRERLQNFTRSVQSMEDALIERAISKFSVHDSRNISECLNLLTAELLPESSEFNRCGSAPTGRMLRRSQTMTRNSFEREEIWDLALRGQEQEQDLNQQDLDAAQAEIEQELREVSMDSFGSRTTADLIKTAC